MKFERYPKQLVFPNSGAFILSDQDRYRVHRRLIYQLPALHEGGGYSALDVCLNVSIGGNDLALESPVGDGRKQSADGRA